MPAKMPRPYPSHHEYRQITTCGTCVLEVRQSLRAQLREAQEERDKADRTGIYWQEEGQKAADELDAAIERGRQAWESGAKAHSEWQQWQDGCIEAEDRAEVAETALAEQRALAEELQAERQEMQDMEKPVPAEAQKEGDDA